MVPEIYLLNTIMSRDVKEIVEATHVWPIMRYSHSTGVSYTRKPLMDGCRNSNFVGYSTEKKECSVEANNVSKLGRLLKPWKKHVMLLTENVGWLIFEFFFTTQFYHIPSTEVLVRSSQPQFKWITKLLSNKFEAEKQKHIYIFDLGEKRCSVCPKQHFLQKLYEICCNETIILGRLLGDLGVLASFPFSSLDVIKKVNNISRVGVEKDGTVHWTALYPLESPSKRGKDSNCSTLSMECSNAPAVYLSSIKNPNCRKFVTKTIYNCDCIP